MAKKASAYVQEELHWFWCNSDADCGNKSSWNACVSAACFGQTTFQDSYTPFVLNAICARSKITAILRELPEYNQYVLYSLYGFTFYSADVEDVYKKLSGPACLIIEHYELTKLCQKYKAGRCNAAEKAMVKTVMDKAREFRQESIDMYVEAKKQLKLKPMIKEHY